MTQFFYDTEFLERGARYPLALISIGMVAEDGREYFAVNSEFDRRLATPWLKKNVVPLLPKRPHPSYRTARQIVADLRSFVGQRKPEFWGYFADYDHVLLAQLFGDMNRWPKGWPMYTKDIQQWREALGNPPMPRQPSRLHDALDDARWVKRAHERLEAISVSRRPKHG